MHRDRENRSNGAQKIFLDLTVNIFTLSLFGSVFKLCLLGDADHVSCRVAGGGIR